MSDLQLAELAIGAPVPDFILPVINRGDQIRLSDLRGHFVVLDFWSAECPWSVKYDAYFHQRVPVWAGQNIRFMAINSNADESDDQVRAEMAARELAFSVLRDRGHEVADAYGATTTPQLFVVDREGLLAYRGAIDDRTMSEEPTVNYLDRALEALRAGKTPELASTRARGCTIVRQLRVTPL
jgi:peroxiredoxin